PFWSVLSRRLSKHRLWGVAMLYSMVFFALVPLLGEGDIAWFYAISVLTGLAYGADLVLPPAIQADVVDVDAAESGTERTGVYFALWSVILKGASGLAGGAGAIALGLVGFESGAENSGFALSALVFLYAGAPIILKGLAVAVIWRFPIDAAAQDALRETIEARAAARGEG
ncbi:MAG: MFS transporter, partial [Pseudomonadota bacterium]